MYDHGRFAPFYSNQFTYETQGYAFTLVHSVVGLEFFPHYILHDVGSKVSSSPKLRPVSLLQLRLRVYTDMSLAELGEDRGTWSITKSSECGGSFGDLDAE